MSEPMPAADNPFDPDGDPALYRRWREWKLDHHPRRLEDLVVTLDDPARLTPGERQALIDRIRRANMALYVTDPARTEPRQVPLLLARQLGVSGLDCNWLAEDDGLTALCVHEDALHRGYIPYTDRPIQWHTDGYYNPMNRQVHALLLHAERPAAEGGENRLMDHEMLYILLRDEDPELVRALMRPQALSIPARVADGETARPIARGPVFSITAQGKLHLRYTARQRNALWEETPAVQQAQARIRELLEQPSPWIFQGRLEAGMGLISNNVLHDRSGFRDPPGSPGRLLYRARFHGRVTAAD